MRSDRTRVTGFKLEEARFKLGIGKKFFTESEGGEALEQLAREAVNASSMEVFKARLDGAMSNLV